MKPKKPGTAATPPKPSEMISTAEAAALKGIAPRTLTQTAQRGRVPGAVKVGGEHGVWLFDKAMLIAWTPAPRGRPMGK